MMDYLIKLFKKEKYFLFSGNDYYPLGGAEDYEATSNNIDDLKKLYKKDKFGWGHITDSDMNILYSISRMGDWEKVNSNTHDDGLLD